MVPSVHRVWCPAVDSEGSGHNRLLSMSRGPWGWPFLPPAALLRGSLHLVNACLSFTSWLKHPFLKEAFPNPPEASISERALFSAGSHQPAMTYSPGSPFVPVHASLLFSRTPEGRDGAAFFIGLSLSRVCPGR